MRALILEQCRCQGAANCPDAVALNSMCLSSQFDSASRLFSLTASISDSVSGTSSDDQFLSLQKENNTILSIPIQSAGLWIGGVLSVLILLIFVYRPRARVSIAPARSSSISSAVQYEQLDMHAPSSMDSHCVYDNLHGVVNDNDLDDLKLHHHACDYAPTVLMGNVDPLSRIVLEQGQIRRTPMYERSDLCKLM
jgi:hypothetical protein